MDKTQGGLKAMRTWRLSTLAAVLTVVMTGTVFSADTVKVFRYDGSLQCEMGRPVSLSEMEKELRAANIAVLAKAKKADGIQHPQMCGASTGMMNVYRIKTSDLEKARVLGFVLYIEGISIARDRRGSNVAMRP